MSEYINCLDALEAELVRVLYNRADQDRLSKAKHVLERYRGVDWIAHQRCPNVEGFGLSGYQRVSVKKHNDLFDLLILSWAPGTQSPVHDHPCERCFLMNICGNMFEERFVADSKGNLQKTHRAEIPERVATWISDDIGLHSVGNSGTTLACSLHCYIPGFTTPCRIFDPFTGQSSLVSAVPKSSDQITLVERIFEQTTEYTKIFDDPRRAPVVLNRHSSEIETSFRALRCPLDFSSNAQPHDEQAIISAIRSACDLSVHTSHTFFLNQLLSKPDPISIASDSLISAMNVNMYDLENAPVMMLIERGLLAHLFRHVGWSTILEPDGIFLPGASLCNLTAMHLAREKFLSTYQSHVSLDKLRVFTSEESHCSIEKACSMLGLGRSACIYVPCDTTTGKMNVHRLRDLIEDQRRAGNAPFFINATCGSTHSGAFDDCCEISDIAIEFGCWFHVDGALGAAFILPEEYPFRNLVKGMSKADSISWNLHKLLGVPLTCSVLLTQHSKWLRQSHSVNRYPSEAKAISNNDPMNKSILSSRRADAFKAWVLWKKYGDMGMANRVRLIYMHNMDFARMIRNYPRRIPIDNPTLPREIDQPLELNEGAFALAYEPVSVCTCFYFIPYQLRERFYRDGPVSMEFELGIVAQRLKRRLLATGSIMMSHFSTRSRPHFWRIPNIHPSMTQENMWSILKLMNRIGNECFPPHCPINWDSGTVNTVNPDEGVWQLAPEMNIKVESDQQQLPEIFDITQAGNSWSAG
jgi:sulfinoalanine decarboxylase/aspartate 1-decarboxylase